MLSLIAAMAKNNVIGHQQRMPWHLPREFQYFKRITEGKPIIMGRHTYDSIGHALPGRRNIVISRQTQLALPDAEVFHDIDHAMTACRDASEIMIIGGAQLYQHTINQVDRMYLTIIDLDTPGDAFFPSWTPSDWHTVSEAFFDADTDNPHAYRCLCLDRVTD